MSKNTNIQKVYLVADDYEDATLFERTLQDNRMTLSTFDSVEKALSAVKESGTPELFVIDLEIKGSQALHFIESLRKDYKPTIPIIAIATKENETDAIAALSLGVDAVIEKPFSVDFLFAHVKNALSRFLIFSSSVEKSVRFDDYVLLLNSGVLKHGDKKVSLSPIEYGVLETLVMNAGESVLPEKIYTEVWKAPFGDVTAVAVYVQRLRRKIEANPDIPRLIKTDFGRGYYFEKSAIKSV